MKINIVNKASTDEHVSEEAIAHYSHFLLAHPRAIQDYLYDKEKDYYDETTVLLDLYNHGVDAWREYHEQYGGVGLADVVQSPSFFKDAIKQKERSERKYYTIQDVIDTLNNVEKAHRHLPLFVCNEETGENLKVTSIETYNNQKAHSEDNPLLLSFEQTLD